MGRGVPHASARSAAISPSTGPNAKPWPAQAGHDGQPLRSGLVVDDRQAVWGEIDQARPVPRNANPVELRDEGGESRQGRVDKRAVDGGFR
jgi:hypothetical protein